MEFRVPFRVPYPLVSLLDLPSWAIPLLLSLAAGVWVWQKGTENQFVTKELRRSSVDGVLALWFAPNGDLIARDWNGVVRWSASDHFIARPEGLDLESIRASFRKAASPVVFDRAWISNDGTKLAVLALPILAVTDVSNGGFQWYCFTEVYDPISGDAPISIGSFTSTGLVVLVSRDGTIEFRDPSRKCEVISRTQTNLQNPDRIEFSDRYVAVSSTVRSALAVLDLQAVQQDVRLQSFPLTSINQLSFAVSSNGRLAVSTGGPSVFISSQTSGTFTDELAIYGPVTAIAFADENRVIAGGNFRDIYLLEKQQLPQKIAEAPLGTKLIAANATHIAFVAADGVTILSRTNATVLTKRARLVLGLGVASFFVALAMLLRDQFTKGLFRNSKLSYELQLPDTPPAELVRACTAGECVLYAGAGLSARAKLPVWSEFVHGLLDYAYDRKSIMDREVREFHNEIDTGYADAVADTIVSRLFWDTAGLHAYLRRVFTTSLTPLTDAHRSLKSLNFSGVLTTNFDNLLERLYDLKSEQVSTPSDTEAVLNALTTGRFFLLKLYGSLDKEAPVMVAPAQYEKEVAGNKLFAQCMETLLLSRTLFFIGASLEGIEAYLRPINLPSAIPRQHFAVVAVEGSGWRAKADLLKRRYGIEVLPYTASPGYPELDIFLRKFVDEINRTPQADAKETKTATGLKRVILENIGTFEKFELDLDPEWQVLLGDNGVGKSTILKAIALALAGEKAQPFASRLLRSGQPSGRIILQTDKASYATDLRRMNDQEVELNITGGRLLSVEGWLAIGFPPLRTVGWVSPKGPSSDRAITSRAVPEDLLPLIAGEPDPRMEKLKQWIIDLEFLTAQNEKLGRGKGNRYQLLIHEMFNVINSTMEGLKLTYKGVEPNTNKILVEDEAGASIPLEALSQGTTSLIGWVGVLMQRLYEVYGEDADPAKRYALILMDELDAHMHPLWQQILVSRLKKAFPHAQFIATTHSPLVVGGMPANQVLPLERDKTGVRKVPIATDVTFGYVDQRLTSPLFKLNSVLPESTHVKLRRYRELLAMKDRGPFQAEFEQLQKELLFRLPPPTVSSDEKRRRMVKKAESLKQIGEDLAEQEVEGSGAILERAEQLRSDLERGPQE